MFKQVISKSTVIVVLVIAVVAAGCGNEIVAPQARQDEAPVGGGARTLMIPMNPIPPPPPPQLPDYVVESIVLQTANGSVVQVRVKNRGYKDVTIATSTRVVWSWSECQGPDSAVLSTPPLAKGQSVTLTFTRPAWSQLPAFVFATADWGNRVISELSETNNTLQVTGPGGYRVC